MTLATLVSFSIFALMAAITPGPNNIMLAASGANYGFRRTLPHIIGVCFGFGCLVIAGGLGVGRFLETFPQFFSILKMLALLFLLYLVWKVGTASSPKLSPDGKPMRFHTAALFQWVNPKGVVMAVSGLTAFQLPHLQANLIYLIVGGPCVLTWLYLGESLQNFLIGNQKLERVVYVLLALSMVASLLLA